MDSSRARRPIHVTCPHCGRISQSKRESIGAQVRCQCGECFVIHTSSTHDCPKCGQSNRSDRATCSMCGTPLTSAATSVGTVEHSLGASAAIPADSQGGSNESEGKDEDEGNAAKPTAVRMVLFPIGVVVVLICIIASWAVGSRGTLPSLEQVEKDLHVWALPKERAVLRGRPVYSHRFAEDASKFETRGDEVFTLHTDDKGNVIAFSGGLLNPAPGADPLEMAVQVFKEQVSSLEPGSEHVEPDPDVEGYGEYADRKRVVQDFFSNYIGDFRISSPPLSEADRFMPIKFEEHPPQSEESYFWDFNGFDIEFTLIKQYKYGDEVRETPDQEYTIIIVKSRAW